MVCPDLWMKEELTFFLQHSGFRVASTAESKEAMVEIGRDMPDLIVVRESCRRLNGDELCIRIRELCNAPIVVLGQSPDEAAGAELLEMGADAYLPTPLDSRALLARIRSLLRRRRRSHHKEENPGLINER